ncbi:MAG: hypothetical protein JWO53_1190 [Chlamydiia bacterium]|nr:hypothetical protein [Chlamydiia bacterium]
MFGTILAVVASFIFALQVFGSVSLTPADFTLCYTVMTVVGALVLFSAFFALSFAWMLLQRTEQRSVPRAQELFFSDWSIFTHLSTLVIFSLFSYYMVLSSALGVVPQLTRILLIAWILFCGIAVDVLYSYLRRIGRYSNHQFLLEKMKRNCLKSISEGREGEGFEWLNNVVEVAQKSIQKGSSHIAVSALSQIVAIIEGYSGAVNKSFVSNPLRSEGVSFLDKVNYLSFYIGKRLEWIYQCALDSRMIPIADEVIKTLGKISLYFIKSHPPTAYIPLLFIEKCGKVAVEMNCEEGGFQASAMLSELTKKYIAISKQKQASLHDVILLSLRHIEQIVACAFQKNKEINAALLMQPFAEVGQMLGSPEYQEFPDREEIIQELRRCLTKFNALDLVMQKKPQGPSEE